MRFMVDIHTDIDYSFHGRSCFFTTPTPNSKERRGNGVMGMRARKRSVNSTTKVEGGTEPRHDDPLWKDMLARFFVPMLQSLLPELARDIDDKRDVLFLDKELRRLARFTRHYEGGEPDGNRCKLCVPKFKLSVNAFFVTLTRRRRSHGASLRRNRPAQHPKAAPSESWLSA